MEAGKSCAHFSESIQKELALLSDERSGLQERLSSLREENAGLKQQIRRLRPEAARMDAGPSHHRKT